MARPRQPRPRPPEMSSELIEAFERMLVVVAFKQACNEQSWAIVRANGSNCCGAEQYEAGEAAVIASGHPRPPEDWFGIEPILDNWIREQVRPGPGTLPVPDKDRPKGSARSSR